MMISSRINLVSNVSMFICLSIAITISGCGRDESDGNESAGKESVSNSGPVQVRFASIETVGQSVVPYAMKHYGFDQKYGLDVEIVPYAVPGGQYIMSRSGAVDVIAGNWIDIHRQRKKGGAQIQAFYGFHSYSIPIIVKPDSTITTFADLRGKRVGMFGATFLDWIILRMAGKVAYGFDIETDTEITSTTPQLLNSLLEKDRIDAAFQFPPLTIMPMIEGKQRSIISVPEIMTEAGFNPDTFYLLWCIGDEWTKQHPDIIVKLQAAMQETYAKLRIDDEIWPTLAAFIKITDTKGIEVYREFIRDVGGRPITVEMIAPAQKILDAMVEIMGESTIGFTDIDPDAFIFPPSQEISGDI